MGAPIRRTAVPRIDNARTFLFGGIDATVNNSRKIVDLTHSNATGGRSSVTGLGHVHGARRIGLMNFCSCGAYEYVRVGFADIHD